MRPAFPAVASTAVSVMLRATWTSLGCFLIRLFLCHFPQLWNMRCAAEFPGLEWAAVCQGEGLPRVPLGLCSPSGCGVRVLRLPTNRTAVHTRWGFGNHSPRLRVTVTVCSCFWSSLENNGIWHSQTYLLLWTVFMRLHSLTDTGEMTRGMEV